MSGGFDGVDAALLAIGAFYVFAGVVATRAAVTSNMLDVALAQISMKPIPAVDRRRFQWLVASSVLVFLGGVALMLRSTPAVWLFALSTIGQAIYLYALAPRYFDRDDPPDAKGRSQTTNAFYIYAIATALVVLAASAGRLRSVAAVPMVEMAAAGVGSLAFAVVLARWLRPLKSAE